MIINTKFDVGDRIYYTSYRSIANGLITSINIRKIKGDPIYISYYIGENGEEVPEHHAFISKEELIASL